MLKVLHCADLHLDSPFTSESAEKSEVRRTELRGSFSSLILFAKSQKVDLVLLSGDLFDSELVTRDTAAFFVKELSGAASCRFVIAPGNHDPFTPDGVYAKTAFPENVFLFRDTSLSKFSFPELNADVYGYAFQKSTLDACPFAGKRPENPGRINLLCGHADVGNPLSPYCPVSEEDIAASGFDYCAFGHIHRTEGVKKVGGSYYGYSGCLEGRDFGETGHKGALYLEISKNGGSLSVSAKGVHFSRRRYEIASADLSGCADGASLFEKAKAAISGKYGADTLLRLTLTGIVPPSLKIDVEALRAKLSPGLFYLEILDRTLPLYDAGALEKDPSVRGAFFREFLPLLQTGTPEERAKAARALRIGLAALAGEDVSGIG